MKALKIGYFADGKWSHPAFERLIEDSLIRILFIVPRTDTRDLTLKKYALRYKIDYLEDVRVNSDDFFVKASEYDCDLFVSMSFNQIFREKIINLPPLKTINCHAGKLPFYRGRNVLNWVLINDEREFGITVHYIDRGVDTGDIILQETFPITDADDYSSILNTAYINCARILHESIKKIQNGSSKRIAQATLHPVGFYCGMRCEGDENINWAQTSRAIFNFIRAICKPGPMARSMINGRQIKINKSELIEHAPSYMGSIGQILSKEPGALIVKTLDSTIKVTEYEYDGVLKIGDRFQTGVNEKL